MVKVQPRQVSNNSPFKSIVCPICNEVKERWNRHHFGDVWKRTCIDCHEAINFYLSKYEENKYSWNDIELVRQLLKERKEVNNENNDGLKNS